MRLNRTGTVPSHSRPGSFTLLQYLLPLCVYLALLTQVPRIAGPDLSPWPDAAEYGLITDRLIHLQPPLLHIGPYAYPARYPLVFPILAAAPAKLVEWLTPAGESYLTYFYWTTIAFGMTSVLLMAHVGAWFTRRRWGGLMAAGLWATHPALLSWSVVTMSETAFITLWLLMLELLQPWLVPLPTVPPRTAWPRAGAAGLLAAALTIAKAPFVFWAIFPALLLLQQWRRSGCWQSPVAFITAGLSAAAIELIYRHQAFGSALGNGYFYWLPETQSRSRMFSGYFLFHNDLGRGEGNLEFFGKQLLGIHHGFYAWSLMLTSTLAALFWLKRILRGRLWHAFHPLDRHLALALWTGVGLAFCLLYFAQYDRLFLLWVPALDLLLASLLCATRQAWPESSQHSSRQWKLALGFAIAAVSCHQLMIFRQAELNIAPRLNEPRLPQFPALLAGVPGDAWLFTNLDLPLVQRLRPHAGPCGTLYAREVSERYLSGHTAQIIKHHLSPMHHIAGDQGQTVSALWGSEFPCLIDAADAWQLAAGTEHQLGADVYLLVIRPQQYANVRNYLEHIVWPLLTARGRLVPIRSAADMTLYRLQWQTAP
jgi:hypothetical protein